MSSIPSLPKGTRDFGPQVMQKRIFILDQIREVFKKYGFQPLETPAMEKLSVLTGNYGEEGDRLLYKVLNSGDFLSKATVADRENSSRLVGKIAEKGLRYDLTVPFARYVSMHRHELVFPFKRYQVQPVWRADRPQKGRYREFYQCDADVVGTESLLCEAEIVKMINEVFNRLGIKDFVIKFNHRGILDGFCDAIDAPEKITDLTISIDKLDKIGWEGVEAEMIKRGFSADQVKEIKGLIGTKGDASSKIQVLKNVLISQSATQGLTDVDEFLDYLKRFGSQENHLELDLALARGLSYYTGLIFEVQINDSSIGSVAGGGRYDNLTAVFGTERIPGVGFSFGVDRLYDAMEELKLFPKDTEVSTEALIVHFNQEALEFGIDLLQALRGNNISAEIYPDNAKLKKQMAYADKKNIPHVIIIGSDEISSGQITLKNMISGDESKHTFDDLIAKLSN